MTILRKSGLLVGFAEFVGICGIHGKNKICLFDEFLFTCSVRHNLSTHQKTPFSKYSHIYQRCSNKWEATLSSAAGPICGYKSQGLCMQSQIMYILWHGRHFVTRKNGGSINGCAMNGNLNALRVNLSVSNAQKVVVMFTMHTHTCQVIYNGFSQLGTLQSEIQWCAGMTCQFQRGYQLRCGLKLCKQLHCIMRR